MTAGRRETMGIALWRIWIWRANHISHAVERYGAKEEYLLEAYVELYGQMKKAARIAGIGLATA